MAGWRERACSCVIPGDTPTTAGKVSTTRGLPLERSTMTAVVSLKIGVVSELHLGPQVGDEHTGDLKAPPWQAKSKKAMGRRNDSEHLFSLSMA